MPDFLPNSSQPLLPRTRRVDLVVELLRHHLTRGEWTDRLPGNRVLRRTLGVSGDTISAAIAQLSKEGLLSVSGPRQRIKILTPAPPRAPSRAPAALSSPVRQILSLIPQDQDGPSKFRLIMEAKLRETLAPHGIQVRSREVKYGTDGRRRRHWDQLLAMERYDAIVAFGGTPWFGRWAVNCGIPVCYIGGNPGPHPIPTAGSAVRDLIRRSLHELFRLGHRRILLPVCGNHAYKEALRKLLAAVFEEAGLPFQPRLSVTFGEEHNPEDYHTCLLHAWPTLRPTAILCMTCGEYLSALSFALQHRLRIPQDLSLIALGIDPVMAWLHPQPTQFYPPIDALVDMVAGWLRRPDPKAPAPPFVELDCTWVPGQTIGPAPS